jgi:hypothetical protein
MNTYAMIGSKDWVIVWDSGNQPMPKHYATGC